MKGSAEVETMAPAPVDHRLLQRYADQNELDYEAFGEAIRSGRLEAVEGV